MKKYPKYKDTGIIWIGIIPDQWKVKKIKHTTYVKGRIGWQGLRSDEFIDEGPYLVTGTDFNNGKVNWNTCYHIANNRYEEDPYIQLREGDLLITKDGTIGKIALVKNLKGKASLNSGIFLIRPLGEDYITPFMYWILNSKIFWDFIEFTKTGSTIAHLYQNIFETFNFPTPPIKEQLEISKFLQEETTKIDSLITQKHKMIRLLEEEKTAIINEAITKGLDSNLKLKESGIDFFPKIPKHWSVKKLKYLISKIGSGITPKGGSETYLSEGIPLLRSQNIHFDGLRLDDVAYISKDVHNNMNGSKVYAGDVLLNITGASIGRCYYVTKEFIEANVNQHVCIVRPNKEVVQTKYLYYFLSSEKGQNQIFQSEKGISREGLTMEELKNFVLVLPSSIEEQKEIVSYLDYEIFRIKNLSLKIEKEITLLEEYRTALIAETVTGKIDVRDYKKKKTSSPVLI